MYNTACSDEKWERYIGTGEIYNKEEIIREGVYKLVYHGGIIKRG